MTSSCCVHIKLHGKQIVQFDHEQIVQQVSHLNCLPYVVNPSVGFMCL